MTTEADDLDARMEAIRLKNEELEKKHREIQEDEKNAKLMNAVVDVRYSEIPKVHPYDNIDLDFDVTEADKELLKNPDYKPKNRRPLPPKELLDEIPPDPVNFLREDVDDNKATNESGKGQRAPNKNRTHNRNRQDRPKQEKSNRESEGEKGDSPPRLRNQNHRSKQPQPQQNRSPQDGGQPKRIVHPQQLRNERRSATALCDESSGQQLSPPTPNRQRQNFRQPNKESDRNNITVEITDGEVRSVKLKSSEKTFGTGRVGYSRTENIQKFTVDTFNPDSSAGQQDKPSGEKPRNRNSRNNHNRRNQKSGPREQVPFQHPTLENIIITKTSVQERLLKIAKNSEATDEPQLSSVVETGNGN